jgi:hypothetical protein
MLAMIAPRSISSSSSLAFADSPEGFFSTDLSSVVFDAGTAKHSVETPDANLLFTEAFSSSSFFGSGLMEGIWGVMTLASFVTEDSALRASSASASSSIEPDSSEGVSSSTFFPLAVPFSRFSPLTFPVLGSLDSGLSVSVLPGSDCLSGLPFLFDLTFDFSSSTCGLASVGSVRNVKSVPK